MGILSKLFGKKKNVKKRKGNPDVYYMPNEDDRMNWAMEKARLTFHYFKECLIEPKEGQQYLSVKAKIEDEEKIEHLWLTEPSFDEDGNIYGIVSNEPIDIKNVQIDEKIGITFDTISDWMIIENGRLIGGYTIRAIRDGLDESELANFDASLGGMFIDEGEDYFMANLETPEGAILSLEQAYDNDDIEAALNCKSFRREAELMLNKTVQIEIDEEIISKTAEVLELSFLNDIRENGMPKFNDIKRAFRRQMVSENHYIITEICYYPDGGKSIQKLNTHKIDNQWKVLGLEE